MITKDQLLSEVRSAAIQGLVTWNELNQAFHAAAPQTLPVAASPERRVGVTDLLYFLGGAVVFIGIVVLLEQHWKELSFLTRTLTTLGTGFAAYYVGLLLSREKKYAVVSQAFFLISALALPIGLGIVFDHFGYSMHRIGVQATISALLTVFFFASFAIFGGDVFLLFSIIYATWLFFSLVGTMTDGLPEVRTWKLMEYRFLITGLVYGILGKTFSDNEHKGMTGPLYGFGIWFFLGAAFGLGGWKPGQNYFWEMIFPGLALGSLFLSVYLKSRSFLTFGALFLIGYIGKITVEYFSDSLGWPLSLVLIGFALMGIGYGAYQLNNRYFGEAHA